MKNIILITGTDTGVGKTWVGCSLARALTLNNYKVSAIKPLETGCTDDLQQNEDGVLLALSTNQQKPLQALQRFCAPLAPPGAADKESRIINFNELVIKVLEYSQEVDFTIVEGAGGLLSPLTWNHNVIDLARSLNAKILLVSSDRLGSINHTLMTLNILKQAELELVGIVFTPPEAPDESTGSNLEAVVRLSDYNRTISVPRTHNKDLAELTIAKVIDWLK